MTVIQKMKVKTTLNNPQIMDVLNPVPGSKYKGAENTLVFVLHYSTTCA